MKAANAAALILIGAICGWSQKVEFGVRGGIPVTGFVEANVPDVSRHTTFDRALFVVGPTLSMVVHDRFRFSLEAMYKRIRGRSVSVIPPDGATFEFRAASWEFPVLFDYSFSKEGLRPFAGGGVIAGHVTKGTTTSNTQPQYQGGFSMGNQLPAYVANAGVELPTRRFLIRPELRYTRWDRNSGTGIKRNQVEVSIGLSLPR